MIVTDRQTDRPRYSVCKNRPHLRSTAMRPISVDYDDDDDDSCMNCSGDNIRGSRQESGNVSGTSYTRDHVQVGQLAVI